MIKYARIPSTARLRARTAMRTIAYALGGPIPRTGFAEAQPLGGASAGRV